MIDRPARFQVHYCRECGERFKTIDRKETGAPQIVRSAHTQEYIHRYAAHTARRTPYASCSRYCEAREQYEEAKSGRRMYGKGAEQPTPRASYEAIFPEED